MPTPSLLLSLPRTSLQRLRNQSSSASSSSIFQDSEDDAAYHKHRLQLKAQSDARISTWTDTVEAKQTRNLQSKADRLALAEKERERIDAEEAKLEQVEREAALARAKALLFEQRDDFKTFRSAQKYSDILHTLEKQMKEKQQHAQETKVGEEADYRRMVALLAEEEAKELANRHQQKEKLKQVSQAQEKMVAEARALKLQAKQAKQDEGALLLAQAEREKVEDHAKHLAAKHRCQQANKATTQANLQLKEYRQQQALMEAQEDAKIAAVVQGKEATAALRLQAEKERFEAKLAARQRMIDRACEELARKTNNDDARLERYIQQQLHKEEAQAANQAERRRKELEAIRADMALHQQRKAAEKQAKQEAAKAQLASWVKINEETVRQEQEARACRLRKNLDLMQYQKQQERDALERQRRRGGGTDGGGVDGADVDLDRVLRQDEEEYFQTFAAQEIDKARKEGKPLYPLLQALKHSAPAALLPSPTAAGKGRKKKETTTSAQARAQAKTPVALGKAKEVVKAKKMDGAGGVGGKGEATVVGGAEIAATAAVA